MDPCESSGFKIVFEHNVCEATDSPSVMYEGKYLKKVARVEQNLFLFKEKVLTNYREFVNAYYDKELAFDLCSPKLRDLAFKIFRSSDHLHELFSFLKENVEVVQVHPTHAFFPKWTKYDIGIQYTICDEKKYKFGRLCFVPSDNLSLKSIELVRRTCASCKETEKVLSSGKLVRYKKCGRCQTTYYCSEECQRKDWHAHKKICEKPLCRAKRA